MTAWVDLKVAWEWPPVVDDLAEALLTKLRAFAAERGTVLIEESITKQSMDGLHSTSDGMQRVVFITVLAEETT